MDEASEKSENHMDKYAHREIELPHLEGGGASDVVTVWRVAELFAGATHRAFALFILDAAGRDAEIA